jgi:acetyl-CoA carboxylase carboxyltransferase component
MSTLDELRRRHVAAEEGGGPERRERQHREGKLSARERIDLLRGGCGVAAAVRAGFEIVILVPSGLYVDTG